MLAIYVKSIANTYFCFSNCKNHKVGPAIIYMLTLFVGLIANTYFYFSAIAAIEVAAISMLGQMQIFACTFLFEKIV